jgi:hypothetical protein
VRRIGRESIDNRVETRRGGQEAQDE